MNSSELKTISEIAKSLNVSRQAIYKKIKNNTELSTALQAFTVNTEKVTTYSLQGQELIKQAFANTQPVKSKPSTVDNKLSTDIKITDNLVSELLTCQQELEVDKIKIQELETENAILKEKADAVNKLTTDCQRLENELSELQSQIEDLKADKAKLNERLDKAENDRTELIESNKELTIALKAAQALHGMDKQQRVIETEQAAPEPQEQPEQKRSFFKRLFGKK
jgi:predicted nuclease with TOPRIM domain